MDSTPHLTHHSSLLHPRYQEDGSAGAPIHRHRNPAYVPQRVWRPVTTLEIVRHALPLRITRCELNDYSLHIGGMEWHLNTTCPYAIDTAEGEFSDDSAPSELEELASRLIGTTVTVVESNNDMDDPRFSLDEGIRISLTADPNDPYEPWTMRVPGILLIGSSPSEIEHVRTTTRVVEPGELDGLGEVRGVRSFPPGWSVSTDEWTVVVACPWQVDPPVGHARHLAGPAPAAIGMQLERIRYSARQCVFEFSDEHRVIVTSDAGRAPWFISNRAAGVSIVGLPLEPRDARQAIDGVAGA